MMHRSEPRNFACADIRTGFEPATRTIAGLVRYGAGTCVLPAANLEPGPEPGVQRRAESLPRVDTTGSEPASLCAIPARHAKPTD
jgi:hypothetical protein